jgi:AraC family transcriptional regulator, regulatory protein of adaptative response / methylated-DNA-[protein]-cysteine methyltransferase
MNNEMLDDRRWQAVCSCEKTWDATFVFAVRTTGVYCRPSCTSRRANRENVSFYETPERARSAGYRACKLSMAAQLGASGAE